MYVYIYIAYIHNNCVPLPLIWPLNVELTAIAAQSMERWPKNMNYAAIAMNMLKRLFWLNAQRKKKTMKDILCLCICII